MKVNACEKWLKLSNVLLLLVSLSCATCPERDPAGATNIPQNTDLGFYLKISGEPMHYEPGELYTISLKGEKSELLEKQFAEFVLVVESDPKDPDHPIRSDLIGLSGTAGSFHLLGDVLTRFSDHCTNTVTHSSTSLKSEIQVLWTAPPVGSGCVTFKASVLQLPTLWARDSGRLSLTLCEQEAPERFQPEVINEPCCACEEAKYEVTFEGLWSEKTHPKDFPKSTYMLHFSDIIGASHSADYRVWEYNGFASKGLTQVAKYGSTRVLESELKAESKHIRTIVKARGLWYPNVNGKTFAVFRTDRKNHLVSLVSMLGPSPDWIVGVSGMELCLQNCSWTESREVLLYPWDAGVDSGTTYESLDELTIPQQPITRITSTHPDNPNQPFFNVTGSMKPLARLTVKRQRLYNKSCANKNDNNDEHGDDDDDIEVNFSHSEWGLEDHSVPGCETSDWSSWSGCSVTCGGKGLSMRTRTFLMPEKALMLGCDRQLIQKEMCSSAIAACEGNRFYISAPSDFLPDDMCATTEWSRWSECSTTCGKGFKSRTRRFYNRMGRKRCPHVETMEKSMCVALEEVCPDSFEEDNFIDPHCAVTHWSEWSPCSVSCGKGLKVRTRLYKVSPQQQTNVDCNVQLMEKDNCDGARPRCVFDQQDANFICTLEKEEGPCRGQFFRWFFNEEKMKCEEFTFGGCRGNSNNFDSYEDCKNLCEMMYVPNTKNNATPILNDQKDLDDDLDDEVHDGYDDNLFLLDDQGLDSLTMEMKKKQMMMLQAKQNMLMNQKAMMMKNHFMVMKQKEMIRLEKEMQDEKRRKEHPVVDCLVTAWSPWSECDANCGRAFRRKFRMVKRFPSEGGEKCPRKLEKRQKCRLSPCVEQCILGPWGPWSPCTESCGNGGTQERRREVARDLSADGHCHSLLERRVCLLSPCPI